MSRAEEYIPSARDATVGYSGGNPQGYYRTQCVSCCDKSPLSNPQRIYGDIYTTADDSGACDLCGVTFLSLSEQCQRDHDDQQSRWSRLPVTHVVEMGMVGAVRCRIY